MIEEPFASGRSFIHRMAPVVKIPAALVLSVPAALCHHFGILGIYLGCALILTAGAGLRPVAVFRRLKPAFWFLAMLWIILPLTFEGTVLYRYGWITLTRPGLVMCAEITVKSVTILLIFTALVATMPVASVGHGLHRLHVPDKLVFLLLMCYRYIAVIQEEYSRLLRAARLRGFTPKTGLHTYRTFAFLAGMLFVRASLRAQRVYKAMLCRGFTGTFHTLDDDRPDPYGRLFLPFVTAIGVGLFLYERIWIKT